MLKKSVKIGAVLLAVLFICTNYCFASGIEGTTLVTGTKKLMVDLTNWLLIIALTLTILLVGYYLLRKSASDEMDAKRWDSRIKVAIICCVGVVAMSGLINVIMNYYK